MFVLERRVASEGDDGGEPRPRAKAGRLKGLLLGPLLFLREANALSNVNCIASRYAAQEEKAH
jgi:hypothetical protein